MNGGWQVISSFPAPAQFPHLAISASVPGTDTMLVFGGEYAVGGMERQEHFPPDLALVLGAGPPPTSSVRTARAAWAYHAANDSWSELPSMPFGMESGPKRAPIVRGRYVLLLGIQQRVSFRLGHSVAWRQQGGAAQVV
eukprot:SAG11_NODE_17523_length_516_cov_0.613909_1_plen_138_part_10